VPGHAFLAWETAEGSGQWDYVETTMIGSHDFAAAQASARATAAHYQALRQANGDDPYQFQCLSLAELRAGLGISPME
jgi:hypothetical protein